MCCQEMPLRGKPLCATVSVQFRQGDLKMASVDERMTVLETRFDTELKHLATKADLKDLEMRLFVRLGGLIAVATGVVVAAMRFWQ